jgi:hypothetical protein
VLPIFNCIVPAWAASFAFQPLFSAFQCFSVSAFDLLFSAFSISVFALTPGNKGSNHAPAEPGVLWAKPKRHKKKLKKTLKSVDERLVGLLQNPAVDWATPGKRHKKIKKK